MLTYTFEDRGDMPYYEYLYVRIRQDILNGNLAAGEKLPSKRTFAGQLSVSVMTVENAYAQLMVEGYIYAVERKGYFVADTAYLEESTDRDAADDRHEILHMEGKRERNETGACMALDAGCMACMEGKRERDETGACMTENCPSDARPREGSVKIIADFTSNTIRPENFPFSVWAKLMRRVLAESREELLLKPPAQGMEVLRRAIAEHLRRFRGMQMRPEQVVIGAGTEYLYGLLIQLLGRDKLYGVENPGYRKISRIYRSNGVTYCAVGMDDNGIDIRALREGGADVIHISPSHHFPTGIVTPISRRAELLSWACERENRYIIEDDYDCEFRFTGRPIPTLAGIDRHDRVIYMNTFSKSLTPSIRISYMVLPESLAEKFRAQLGFYSCTVSNFEQMTLAAFLSEGYFEKHINRLRNYYREKRNRLTQAIQEALPEGLASIEKEDAGLHFLVRLRTDHTDRELKESARREGILLTCLSDYYEKNTPSDEVRTGTLVINYSGIDEKSIDEAAEKLHRAVG